MNLTFRSLFIISAISILCNNSNAQEVRDIWDVPWRNVGDSISNQEKVIVTGKITMKSSGEIIDGASISVESFRHFDYSDNFGRYVLELPPGKYRVTVRHVGFRQIYMKLNITSGGVLDIAMEEGAIDLDEVVISSRAIDSNIKDPIAGLTTLTVKEIKTLPSFMGEIDVIKSLQLLPGVSSVGEGSSGFNVRGGRTDQNLILFNGVPLFSTSHALGFVSAFNQDIIRDFSLYKGNVPANYGGRASSVLEVNTRKGNSEKWSYSGGIGFISSRLSAEGPINNGNTNVLIAGRVSYADWFLKKVKDPNVNKSSETFYDFYTSVDHEFSTSSSLKVFYYASNDNFRFSDQFGYKWNNQIVSTRWQGLADRKASPSVAVAYGHFKSSLIEPSGINASQLDLTLNYLQVKPSVNFIPNEQHNITAGFEGIAYIPRPESIHPINGNTAVPFKEVDKNRGVELSVFANDNYKISENISLAAGVRFSTYAHIGPDTVFRYLPDMPRDIENISDTLYYSNNETITTYSGFEPRISLRVNVTDNQSIKTSYNRMRQYIHQISNSAAPTPIDFWQVSNEYLPPQIADNYSIGYFLNSNDNRFETSLEVFYKKMENLVEYKDFPELYLNNHIETELLTGKGRAYGGELYLRKIKGKWTGWISYTYTQTEVQVTSDFESESVNNGTWFPTAYNKPHTFNLVVNRWLYKNSAFSFIASYNSGRPFTAIESSYIIDDTVVPIYSDRNKYQIPDYFRIDVSLTVGNVFKKIDDSLVFSVYNLLGRENAYSVFYQRPKSTYFIPGAYKLSILGNALPSITYNFKF